MEKYYITPELEGRLGNLLFEIITSWAIAKKNQIEVILDIKFKDENYYKYYNIFFKHIRLVNLDEINFIKKQYDVYECCLNNVLPDNNYKICGYIQNANNFNIYTNEVLKTFFNIDSEKFEENDNFFIHVRLTDFKKSPFHNVNLVQYYERAINYLKEKKDISKIKFYIISDDIKAAKKKSFLNILPKENIILVNNKKYDEISTLDIFKNCSLGGIMGNSTYAWWGAYLITNKDKIVICPNKFGNSNIDYSGLYMDYTVISVE